MLNAGNSDTFELLIAVMMATEGCVTLNRWERESERQREERMCEKVLWLFAYIPGEVARGNGLSALFRSSPP